jgi:hypothetical protein
MPLDLEAEAFRELNGMPSLAAANVYDGRSWWQAKITSQISGPRGFKLVSSAAVMSRDICPRCRATSQRVGGGTFPRTTRETIWDLAA